jgi:hypothetical protein
MPAANASRAPKSATSARLEGFFRYYYAANCIRPEGSLTRQRPEEVSRIKMDTGSVLNLVPPYRCPLVERSL